MEQLIPFLMFCGERHGQAEAAIDLYCDVFEGSRVVSIDRYGANDSEPEGTVRTAVFEVGGHTIRAIDSAAPHPFTFTPAISLWVECSSLAELDRVADRLVSGGQFLMPPADYGFSTRFCWVADRFGVTWQLSFGTK